MTLSIRVRTIRVRVKVGVEVRVRGGDLSSIHTCMQGRVVRHAVQ